MQLIVGELRPRAIRHTLANFEIRTPQYTGARSLIALAQLTILAFTPYSALMQNVLGQPLAPNCSGIRAAGIYCLTRGLAPWIPTVLMALVLLGVVIGVLPTPLALLHAWVAFSIGTAIALPDGGDQAAVVLTILIIVISFGDDRIWAWSKISSVTRPWRSQVALAGLMILRIQIAIIYLNSSVAKMFTTDWVNGTEEFYVLRDPYFGASGPLAQVMEWMTQSAAIAAGLSWGSIILEVSVGVLILCGPRARSVGLLLAIVLHASIIFLIGLWSFGLIMIGAVAIAASPVTPWQREQVVWYSAHRALLYRRRQPRRVTQLHPVGTAKAHDLSESESAATAGQGARGSAVRARPTS